MFKAGDLVRIKNVDEMWFRLKDQIAIFICYEEEANENEMLTNVVRPIHSEMKIKFATEDLELVCRAEEVDRIWKEEKLERMA